MNYFYALSALILTLNSISINAEPLKAEYDELECHVSLEPLSPAVGAKVSLGDDVNVLLNYTFKNVPAGIQIQVSPGIISNEKDFQKFLPVKGISLFGDNTLIHAIDAPEKPSLSGRLQFSYTNQGESLGAFDAIIATLGFSHQGNNDERLIINPNINQLQAIPEKDIHCDTDITTTVNWFFSNQAPSTKRPQ